MSLLIFCYREERSEYRGCGEYSRVHDSAFHWEAVEDEEKAADWLVNQIWPHDDSEYRIVVLENPSAIKIAWSNSYSASGWSQAFETGGLNDEDFETYDEYEATDAKLNGLVSTIQNLVRTKIDALKSEEALKKATTEQARRQQAADQELARKQAEFDRLKKELGK
jgi:hypothetical protein